LPDRDIQDGVIDYLDRYKDRLLDHSSLLTEKDLALEPALIDIRRTDGRVRLLAAGNQVNHTEYARKVNDFDWDDFYKEWNGAQLIEFMRRQLQSMADIVLIDSRTGITDVGGICTLQLPDIVVLVFTFNEQNITGLEAIAQDLSRDNPVLKKLGRRPELLLLPSRKDLSEIERLRKWEREAAERLAPYITSKRVKRRYPNTLSYVRDLAVPYVPHYAYGEEIAVDSEKGFELVEPLRILAELLVGEQKKTRRSHITVNLSVKPQIVDVGDEALWTVSLHNDGDEDLRQVTVRRRRSLLQEPFSLMVNKRRRFKFSAKYDKEGQETETVTVSGVDNTGDTVQEEASASVQVRQVPQIEPGDKRLRDRRALTDTFDDFIWQRLIRSIANGTCTPFIGSGASMGSAPLHSEIARMWAKEFSYPLADPNNLPRVSQFLAVRYDPLFSKEQLKKLYTGLEMPDFSEPDEPHRILAELPLPIYITTNYDDFLVQALRSQDRSPELELCRWNVFIKDHPSVFEEDSYFEPSPSEPIVFHLYGHVNTPESLVLTEGDRQDFLINVACDRSLLPSPIQQAIFQPSLLIVGYDADEWMSLFRLLVGRTDLSPRGISVITHMAPDEVSTRSYLESYLASGLGNVKVYWGTAKDFLSELRVRWERYRLTW
jgi:hypothetical protein